MTRDDVAETSSSPTSYLIDGDESCTHETQFLGSDMASNRYYQCERCGGSIVQKGRGQYEERPGEERNGGNLADIGNFLTSNEPPQPGLSLLTRVRRYLSRKL